MVQLVETVVVVHQVQLVRQAQVELVELVDQVH